MSISNIHIRRATDADVPFLWEMLYQALYIKEGQERPPRDILKLPELARSLENWGRDGDVAFIATGRDSQSLGAVWLRLFNDQNRTYGYVNTETPILGIALLPEYRQMGVGTLLLQEVFIYAKSNHIPSISLSVDPENPARRLYERNGFIHIGEEGTSWTMVVNV